MRPAVHLSYILLLAVVKAGVYENEQKLEKCIVLFPMNTLLVSNNLQLRDFLCWM